MKILTVHQKSYSQNNQLLKGKTQGLNGQKIEKPVQNTDFRKILESSMKKYA